MDPRQINTKLRQLLKHIERHNNGRGEGIYETNKFSIFRNTPSASLPPILRRFSWDEFPIDSVYMRSIAADDTTNTRDPRGQGRSLQLAILGMGYYDYSSDGGPKVDYEKIPFYVTMDTKSSDDSMIFSMFMFDVKKGRWVQIHDHSDNVEDIFGTLNRVFSDISLTLSGAKSIRDTNRGNAVSFDEAVGFDKDEGNGNSNGNSNGNGNDKKENDDDDDDD